jgi:hypothetical protein
MGSKERKARHRMNLTHKDIDACSQSQMLDDAIDSLIDSLN